MILVFEDVVRLYSSNRQVKLQWHLILDRLSGVEELLPDLRAELGVEGQIEKLEEDHCEHEYVDDD